MAAHLEDGTAAPDGTAALFGADGTSVRDGAILVDMVVPDEDIVLSNKWAKPSTFRASVASSEYQPCR
jgi:hypothetical protein